MIEMLELILVRHGETESNARGTYLGWTDVELNENGIQQAQEAAEKLKDEQIGAVYSSSLKRAYNSSFIINRYHSLNICTMEGLKERNFGRWDDLLYDEIKERFEDEHDEWIKDWINFRILDGESGADMYERVGCSLDRIIQSHIQGKILIVTHSGCIKMGIAHLLGLGIEGMWKFAVNHGSISRVQLHEGYNVLMQLNA